MYRNKFIALIKKDGIPLRELGNKYVYLPFGSEYSIELRNNNYKRALAKIYIDGTPVTQNGIVINSKTTINLERFILDGNLSKGKRFKFVSVNDSPIHDPNNSQNGVVKIELWLEKDYFISPISSSWWPTTPLSYLGGTTTLLCGTVTCATTTSRNSTSTWLSDKETFNNISNTTLSNTGVTVEGGNSNQQFTVTHPFELETYHTTLELILQGVENEITTSSTMYCTKCGKKVQPTHSFCSRCGAVVVVE